MMALDACCEPPTASSHRSVVRWSCSQASSAAGTSAPMRPGPVTTGPATGRPATGGPQSARRRWEVASKAAVPAWTGRASGKVPFWGDWVPLQVQTAAGSERDAERRAGQPRHGPGAPGRQGEARYRERGHHHEAKRARRHATTRTRRPARGSIRCSQAVASGDDGDGRGGTAPGGAARAPRRCRRARQQQGRGRPRSSCGRCPRRRRTRRRWRRPNRPT